MQLKEEPNELTTLFGVEGCDTFVYLTPGKPLSDFEKLTPRTAEELSTCVAHRMNILAMHVPDDFSLSYDAYLLQLLLVPAPLP